MSNCPPTTADCEETAYVQAFAMRLRYEFARAPFRGTHVVPRFAPSPWHDEPARTVWVKATSPYDRARLAYSRSAVALQFLGDFETGERLRGEALRLTQLSE